MTEIVQVLAVVWCGITYWLGGQQLPYFNRGFKAIRRFILPIGLFVFLLILGSVWWKSAIACVLLSGALHMGYGTSLLRYAVAGLLMALPSLILGWHLVILLPILSHTLFGYWSLRDNNFRWALVGLLQGISVGLAYTVRG